MSNDWDAWRDDVQGAKLAWKGYLSEQFSSSAPRGGMAAKREGLSQEYGTYAKIDLSNMGM